MRASGPLAERKGTLQPWATLGISVLNTGRAGLSCIILTGNLWLCCLCCGSGRFPYPPSPHPTHPGAGAATWSDVEIPGNLQTLAPGDTHFPCHPVCGWPKAAPHPLNPPLASLAGERLRGCRFSLRSTYLSWHNALPRSLHCSKCARCLDIIIISGGNSHRCRGGGGGGGGREEEGVQSYFTVEQGEAQSS